MTTPPVREVPAAPERPRPAEALRAARPGRTATPSRAPVRVAFYCDGHALGGAEINLGRLLSRLSPRVHATVLGTHPGVVARIAEGRPGTATRVLPQIRSSADARTIAAHAAAIRRARPEVLQVSLNRPWGSQWAVLSGLALPRVRVVAVENSPREPAARRHRLYTRLVARVLPAHVALGNISGELTAGVAGVPAARITKIPIGVPDDPLQPLPRVAAGPVIGTVARLDRIKGIDLLLRALPELDGVTAVIVGDGEEREALGRLAERLGVADRVVFAGWSDRARDHLTTFDAYVQPSRFDALSLSVVEAMLAGLPVVATAVGGMAEAVRHGETGLLTPPEDPAALAHAIRAVLADRSRRREMGRAGRVRALERFGVDRMAAGFEALYAELVG